MKAKSSILILFILFPVFIFAQFWKNLQKAAPAIPVAVQAGEALKKEIDKNSNSPATGAAANGKPDAPYVDSSGRIKAFFDTTSASLTGHWRGKLKMKQFDIGTVNEHEVIEDYDLYVIFYQGNYTGIAVTRGKVTVSAFEKNPGTRLEASFILSKQNDKYALSEKQRLNNSDYIVWPQKDFVLTIQDDNGTKKMVGTCTTMNNGFSMNMTRISAQLDNEYGPRVEDLFLPKIEIAQPGFTSATGNNFFGYMDNGSIDFTLINHGHESTQQLNFTLGGYDATVAYKGMTGTNAPLKPGESRKYQMNIAAVDRVTTDALKFVIIVNAPDGKKEICHKDLTIAVRQD